MPELSRGSRSSAGQRLVEGENPRPYTLSTAMICSSVKLARFTSPSSSGLHPENWSV